MNPANGEGILASDVHVILLFMTVQNFASCLFNEYGVDMIGGMTLDPGGFVRAVFFSQA